MSGWIQATMQQNTIPHRFSRQMDTLVYTNLYPLSIVARTQEGFM